MEGTSVLYISIKGKGYEKSLCVFLEIISLIEKKRVFLWLKTNYRK